MICSPSLEMMQMNLGGIECLEEVCSLASKLCALSSKGCETILNPVPNCLLKTTNVGSKSIFSLIPESCAAYLLPLFLPVPLPGFPFPLPSPHNSRSSFKSQQQFCLNHVDFADIPPFPSWTRNKDSFACVPAYFLLLNPIIPPQILW